MGAYTLQIAEVVGSYDETPLVMIDATITNVDGRFSIGALPYEAVARDGATEVRSFMTVVSPNGKELHAFFTTDAFTVFPGPFDIVFGPLGRVAGTIEDVDITTLVPLSAVSAAFGLPDADNAWLASLG